MKIQKFHIVGLTHNDVKVARYSMPRKLWAKSSV